MGPLWDAECAFTFTREAVNLRDKQGTTVLTGWIEETGLSLWRISLHPGESNLPSIPNDANQAKLAACSAYDLPSVAALIRYFHAAAGYPVRYTWNKSIGAGNYSSWPWLTLSNATKYCPSAKAIIMGHLVQKRQGVRSTNPKPQPPSSPEDPMPQVRSNKIFLQVTPISKFYSKTHSSLPCPCLQWTPIRHDCVPL